MSISRATSNNRPTANVLTIRLAWKGMMLAAMVFALPVSLPAQNGDMKDALDRKYDILQQQADTERMRADAEIERSRTERRTTGGQTNRSVNGRYASASSQTYNVSTDDALAGTNAPSYLLSNGVVLRASGDFLPTPPGACIANCK